ncbi:MAG TPA: GNAT family N-acetyltransferase [Chitinophagaceae bacterium]|nr:GNAT family N-acetyltransferase [Chitinophagaceae bacterium]
MEINKAKLVDIPKLVALINSAYRGEDSKKGWTTEADLLEGQRVNAEGLDKIINTPGSIILKCCNEEENIIGCVYLKQNDKKMYLGMLTVSPTLQAGGIGKQILKAAEEYAAQQNCNAIEMTVISVRLELIGWYNRHGYHDTGKRSPFPDDPLSTKKQSLEFITMEKSL